MMWLWLAPVIYVAGFLHGRYQAREVEETAVSAWGKVRSSARSHGLDATTLALAVAVLMLGFVLWRVWTSYDNYVDCQAEYQASSFPRSVATETRDEELSTFLIVLADPKHTDAEATEAFENLTSASTHLEEVRDKYPLPECGSPPQ